ncbi:hypothetical protein B0H13DRAFT_2317973 [Mycena leptocephala]|nr:hypothetical protein B0H13DRAFT_2317973 [Mycena leptocephala]
MIDARDLHARFPQLDVLLRALARSFMHTSTFLHFRCATQLSSSPRVYTHSSPRTGSSAGYEGAAWVYMDLDEHCPSPSTTRFALPFLIRALVVHPSSPLPAVRLRMPTVLSLHR